MGRSLTPSMFVCRSITQQIHKKRPTSVTMETETSISVVRFYKLFHLSVSFRSRFMLC